MLERTNKNNQAVLIGEIISGFTFSHEVFGEGFYTVQLKVDRLSNNSDVIPLLISERLIDVSQSYVGSFMEVRGQFRSYNKHGNNRSHLILSFFVQGLALPDFLDDRQSNMIYLDGYICKEPIHRITPRGREVADVLLAVNRGYGKSDYIPCICWGRNARYVSTLPIGTHVKFTGRIQSREYQKQISEDTVITKTAYEISVSKINRILDDVEAEKE